MGNLIDLTPQLLARQERRRAETVQDGLEWVQTAHDALRDAIARQDWAQVRGAGVCLGVGLMFLGRAPPTPSDAA